MNAKLMIFPDMGHERAIRDLIRGVEDYAKAFKEDSNMLIGESAYADKFLDVVSGIRFFLTGYIGRFNSKELDDRLVDLLNSNGFIYKP